MSIYINCEYMYINVFVYMSKIYINICVYYYVPVPVTSCDAFTLA